MRIFCRMAEDKESLLLCFINDYLNLVFNKGGGGYGATLSTDDGENWMNT